MAALACCCRPPCPCPACPCSAPGERLQAKLASGDKAGMSEGVTGLTKGPARTGVRELTYRLVFIACGTQVGPGGRLPRRAPLHRRLARSTKLLGPFQACGLFARFVLPLDSCPARPSLQPLDQKSGMINIRADDDQEPEEVLAQLSLEQRVGGGSACRGVGQPSLARCRGSGAGSADGCSVAAPATSATSAVADREACAPRRSARPPALQEQLEEMRRDSALYDRLAASVAPNVHGHTDVKRAVLLMLLGGVHKQTKEVRARLPAAAPARRAEVGQQTGGSMRGAGCRVGQTLLETVHDM